MTNRKQINKSLIRNLDVLKLAEIDVEDNSVVGLAVIRNELGRLPYLLEYYRSLKVSHFLFVSDNSTDGSTEYLLEQRDCSVFKPLNTFSQANCGVDWQNSVLDAFCRDSWVVIFDADELLVYPFSEQISLPQLCSVANAEGANVVKSFLLDMYPSGPVEQAEYLPGTPFLTASSLFDAEYMFKRSAKTTSYVPNGKVIGGPRARKFYSFQYRNTLASRAIMYILSRAVKRFGFARFGSIDYMPSLLKAPLVKWVDGSLRTGNHNIKNGSHVKFATFTSAILHFKFFADFHLRALEEVGRGQHFNGAQEYKRYVKMISRKGSLSFLYSGSREYAGSHQLIELGLIESSDALERLHERAA